ncbi:MULTISPECIES: OmpP1/FadL family transporter [unclassified Ensifer]|uniref:OmpP1/FadL family transporter n=1 Tax=unclassified Ensifer TaxID=2633371 RepID=UPI000813106E|nr:MULTISPECIES: OmpP1/FadL family transporter [unclassified Ensifer]OCP00940.1 long-chain fatty acid transporter [Ensifer sp. LC11]OCP01511.1 long-chain fatty acid transporter [Ensifer sp. LC13]OCP02059.1 long-chain fatty acid transporter [Ensifer sp. LC14]OCP30109.1 long-chain fatty acid transporter [Ensifer sp. LC499]
MAHMNLKRGVLAVAAGLLFASAAHAGGLERGGYNIDLLFDPSDYAAEASATYVNPQRELNNVQDAAGGGNLNGRPNSGIGDTESYWVPRIGVKAALGSNVDCMADYSQPWGAHTKPGVNWAGANDNTETKIDSDNYAATCSYKWDMGKGQFRVIGGVFYQEVSGFKERLVQELPGFLGLSGIGRLDLEGNGWGWRAGVGYEIPEYAVRASLVYNSAVDLGDVTGTLDLRQLPLGLGGNPLAGRVTDVYGTADMPDSLELKIQTGVAPGWVVFGSVKWTDWSQLQILPFCPTSTRGIMACRAGSPVEATTLDLLYRDGWTISGGVGHKFNEKWSGAASLTWDRGTSTGLGTQTDTWTLGAGVSYAATENIEWRVAGAVGILTGGHSGTVFKDGLPYGNRASYDFDDDFVGAISTSLKVKF